MIRCLTMTEYQFLPTDSSSLILLVSFIHTSCSSQHPLYYHKNARFDWLIALAIPSSTVLYISRRFLLSIILERIIFCDKKQNYQRSHDYSSRNKKLKQFYFWSIFLFFFTTIIPGINLSWGTSVVRVLNCIL